MSKDECYKAMYGAVEQFAMNAKGMQLVVLNVLLEESKQHIDGGAK